jgi:myo-inositol-1(or 4)-monophosphatase
VTATDDPLSASVFGEPPPGADPLVVELAATALAAAQSAAKVLAGGGAGADLGVETKSSATDMVSNVDLAAEAAVAEVLHSRRPDDAVLGEEGTTSSGTTGVRWVVDPLDGTTNFLFGLPQFAVSVAAELDGETAVGVVIDPSRSETWAAARGWGARRNGRRCAVASGRSTLATALVATGFGYQAGRRAWQAQILTHVLPAVRDVRRFGAAALDLCWVGGGLFDAYYEWGLNPWDLAAGQLICQEAGGRAEALEGRVIVAATQVLFGPLCDLLADAGALEPPPGTEPKLW